MICLLVYKPCYENHYHAKNSLICLTISYTTIFVCCCIAYVFKGQYVLILILCSIIAYANNHLGRLQYGAERFEIIKDPYAKLKEEYIKRTEFNLKTCTKDELEQRCREVGIYGDDLEFCLKVFGQDSIGIVDWIALPENSDKYLDEQVQRNRKTKLKKRIMRQS